MKIEPTILQDIYDLFNDTINQNAHNALRRILTDKQDNITAILNRQQVIKCFIDNYGLFSDYHYPVLHYREVFLMIETDNFIQILSQKNPTKTLKNNKRHYQTIKGKTIQLVLFFHFYYHKYIQPFDANKFPKDYSEKFEALKAYFESYNLNYYYEKIQSKKMNVVDVFELIQIFQNHYSNKEQFIFIDHFSEFEAFISIAKQTVLSGFQFPEIGDNRLVLKKFYHPKVKNPILNSFSNPNGVLLLTGSNMAGKSNFLKVLVICIYLAHIGLHNPAKNAKIPFYNEIYIFINNNDDLTSGYSYFMQEVLNLKEVVLKCNDKLNCFVLFDELFKGTNLEDALEITKTTLNGLLKFPDSFFGISSHIHQLKDLTNSQQAIHTYYLECLIDNGTPYFTYKIKEGFSDLKLGRVIFEKEKLNELLL